MGAKILNCTSTTIITIDNDNVQGNSENDPRQYLNHQFRMQYSKVVTPQTTKRDSPRQQSPPPPASRCFYPYCNPWSIFFQVGLAALAIALYQLYSRFYDWTPCSSDPPINFDRDPNSYHYTFRDSCKLFSSEYTEAREKFRNAVVAFGTRQEIQASETQKLINTDAVRESGSAELVTFPVVVDLGGETEKLSLTIDIAVLPGNTKELGTIVHSSGVHGIEGYAGSAIQLALLELLSSSRATASSSDSRSDERNENTIRNDLRERPTIVMVHAVNPVGMAEFRRCNENNVDLNRNGIRGDTGDAFKEFLRNRDPNVAGYDDFRHLFVPDTDGDSHGGPADPTLLLYDTTVGFFAKAIPALWKHGFSKLKRAMVSGQYHDPGGLNYGGEEWQPSVRRLLDFFVKDRPEFFRDSPSVVWIDVHTGLGPFGKDSIQIYGRREQGDPPPNTERALADYYTAAHSVSSDEDMFSNQAFTGYELTRGILMEFLADAYRDLVESGEGGNGRRGGGARAGFFMWQEFGTLPGTLVGRALILDNALYQLYKRRPETGGEEAFSYRSPFLKQAFYPQSTEWRSSVVRRGVALFLQSVEFTKARRNARVVNQHKHNMNP